MLLSFTVAAHCGCEIYVPTQMAGSTCRIALLAYFCWSCCWNKNIVHVQDAILKSQSKTVSKCLQQGIKSHKDTGRLTLPLHILLAQTVQRTTVFDKVHQPGRKFAPNCSNQATNLHHKNEKFAQNTSGHSRAFGKNRGSAAFTWCLDAKFAPLPWNSHYSHHA